MKINQEGTTVLQGSDREKTVPLKSYSLDDVGSDACVRKTLSPPFVLQNLGDISSSRAHFFLISWLQDLKQGDAFCVYVVVGNGG